MRLLAALALMALLASCASDQHKDTQQCVSGKPFASDWFTIADGYVREMRLSSLAAGGNTAFVVLDKSICEITISTTGFGCSGDYHITESEYLGGGGGDAGCSGLVGNGTYRKESDRLVVCQRGCNEYR